MTGIELSVWRGIWIVGWISYIISFYMRVSLEKKFYGDGDD